MPKSITIAQLSDLHLSKAVGTDISYEKFTACLDVVLSYRPDFLLLTGDLVNDGDALSYHWLFDQLKQTNLPFAAIAGNHDVTYEHNSHLPFADRHFSPISADKRLVANERYVLGDWQLLCLDSTLPAYTHGHLSDDSLAWLDYTLNRHQMPAIIAMHHQPLPVLSAWIDSYKLDNADDFWQILEHQKHARAIVCGHVHQAHTITHKHSTLYTCPAISRQFKPFAPQFALDNQASGFRLFKLTGTHLHSQIIRLKTSFD